MRLSRSRLSGLSIALVAIATASAGAAPAAAQVRGQAQIADQGGKSVVRFDPFGFEALRNLVHLRWDPDQGALVFADPQGGMQAGPGCTGGPFQLLCGISPDQLKALIVQLGGGADRFRGVPPGSPLPPPRLIPQPWVISGGFGPDAFKGGRADERMGGGPGPDRIRGGKGNDRLFGGDGNDALDGGPGVDVLDGGRGADLLRGSGGGSAGGARAAGGKAPPADLFRGGYGGDRFRVWLGFSNRIHCGPGRDRVSAFVTRESILRAAVKQLQGSGANLLSAWSGGAKLALPSSVRIRLGSRGITYLNDCELIRILSR